MVDVNVNGLPLDDVVEVDVDLEEGCLLLRMENGDVLRIKIQ